MLECRHLISILVVWSRRISLLFTAKPLTKPLALISPVPCVRRICVILLVCTLISILSILILLTRNPLLKPLRLLRLHLQRLVQMCICAFPQPRLLLDVRVRVRVRVLLLLLLLLLHYLLLYCLLQHSLLVVVVRNVLQGSAAALLQLGMGRRHIHEVGGEEVGCVEVGCGVGRSRGSRC